VAKIKREPSAAAKEVYDLIVVGGGIYGAMLSLEASRRGLRPLLIERGDFGEATSFNSLRIVHGGIRYLQRLDLHRFHESVSERRWFLKTFPGLVKPLPCLMPLYGNGLRHSSFLRIALWVNNLISYRRNRGIRPDRHLPPGRVIDADQTREIFPSVDTEGLQGGAVWYDAYMPDSQRLIIEILRWACEYGAVALNYVEVNQLLKSRNGVAGVAAIDRESGQSFEYMAKVVVNATGPWCRNLAACFDRDEPTLFKSSIAWNVLLNRKALSNYALAVTPKKPGARTYFLVPWKGMLLAGTGHAKWLEGQEEPMPSDKLLSEFLDDLNRAIPTLEASQDEILHVFAGLLPAKKVGSATLADRGVILDHAEHGGPRGLYSISGVKFTTARLVAEKTLNRIFHGRNHPVRIENFGPPQDVEGKQGIFDFNWYPSASDSEWKDSLRLLIAEESVRHLDDLILRRTTLWDNPSRAMEIAPVICELFDWDNPRCSEEVEGLIKKLGRGEDCKPRPNQSNNTRDCN